MRHFNGLIFMGNGDAEKKCKILHALLDEAISISSGLQQGVGHCTDKELINLDREITDAVKDIFCALTGREVGSYSALIYPPTKCGKTYPEKDLQKSKIYTRNIVLDELIEDIKEDGVDKLCDDDFFNARVYSQIMELSEHIKVKNIKNHICEPVNSDFQFHHLSSARCCICGKFMKKKMPMYVKGIPMKTTTEN